ncbi:MAG: hypothetical protein R3C28_08255 [Pirellulaceae bacterium]
MTADSPAVSTQQISDRQVRHHYIRYDYQALRKLRLTNLATFRNTVLLDKLVS